MVKPFPGPVNYIGVHEAREVSVWNGWKVKGDKVK